MESWFVTGSEHRYGDETLTQVAQNSSDIQTDYMYRTMFL